MNKIYSTDAKLFLSLVVITYNSERTIKDCLASLKKIGNLCRIEIVVVDNSSSDGTKDELKKLQKVGLIDSLYLRKENYGFAKSVNFAVSRTRGNAVALVNPDTYIRTNVGLTEFIEFIRENPDKIVGPMMTSRNGDLERSYVSFPNFFTYIFDFTNVRKIFPNNVWHKKFYYIDHSYEVPTIVDAISGAFVVFSRKIFDSLGGFDERFFMYLEDIDFCYRANRDLGVISVFFPGTDILHIAGESSGNKDRVNHQAWLDSRQKYVLKNETNILLRLIVILLFFIDSIFIKFRIKNYESSSR